MVQEGNVAAIRAKYGRPGASGRKRKTPVLAENTSIQKIKRAKVKVTAHG